jgi:hypothetical protein
MMKQAVEQCGGDDRIAEDLAPFVSAKSVPWLQG